MAGNFKKFTKSTTKREKDIEGKHREKQEKRGGKALKFVSPGYAGAPDRIYLNPIPEEHRAIVAKYMRFVEFKAPDKKPTALQAEVHEELRELGYCVLTIDSDDQEVFP